MVIAKYGYFNEVIPGNITARVFTLAAANRFWTADQDSVRVTPLVGGTREVQVSPGEFGAFGIYNNSDAVTTLQCPAPVSEGTQWYLASATHTWADGASDTEFELLHCGSVAQQPAGFIVDPGNKITMPLAYVPIAFGSTIPGTPLDLRAMGTAGGSVSVNSAQALEYLDYLGAEVWFNKTRYSRVLNTAGDAHEWLIDPGTRGKSVLQTYGAFGTSATNWSANGLGAKIRRNGNSVEMKLRIRRSSGGDLAVSSTGGVVDQHIFTLDEVWWPPEDVPGESCTYIDQGLGNQQGIVSIADDGKVYFTAGVASRNVKVMPAGSWSIAFKSTWLQEA